MSDTSSLSRLTVVVLKDKLRQCGLPVSGKKAQLVERLANYYQQTNNSTVQSNTTTVKKATTPKKAKATPKKTLLYNEAELSPIRKFPSNSFNNAPQSFQFDIQQQNNNSPVKKEEKQTTFEPDLNNFSIYSSTRTFNESIVENKPLHFILPIVGTEDTEEKLIELFKNNLILQNEYEQRLKIIQEQKNIKTESPTNLTMKKTENFINFNDYKQWKQAISKNDTKSLDKQIKIILKSLQSIKEEGTNVAHQEQLERISKMIKKLQLEQIKQLSLDSIIKQLTSYVKLFTNENFLKPIISCISSLSVYLPVRKSFSPCIQRILDLLSFQIENSNGIYSNEMTVELCYCLRMLIRTSATFKELQDDVKKKCFQVTIYFCRQRLSHPSILDSCLRCLSIICNSTFGNESFMEFIYKNDKYFLESIFIHLSHSTISVVIASVLCFINIASLSDENVDKLIQFGILDKIHSIVRYYFFDHSDDAQELVRECYFCISNFAGGTTNQVKICLQRGILSTLLSQYPDGSESIKKEMLWCLSNFFLSNCDSSFFDDIRVFSVSLSMLQDPDVSDADMGQLRKGLNIAKNDIFPNLTNLIDHPLYDNLMEML